MFPTEPISQSDMVVSGARGGPSSGHAAIARDPQTNKVRDGRDFHLTRLVHKAWRTDGLATADAIADAAWHEFQDTTDLTRPAKDGKRPWQLRDAIAKARRLLRKEKAGAIKRVVRSRGRIATPAGSDPSDQECEAFNAHVLALHQAGRLPTIDWRLSELMLSRLRQGQCVDSVSYLAERLGVSKSTAQRARRNLLVIDLWKTARQRGDRKTTAPYFPHFEKVAKPLARQLQKVGGVSSLTPNTSVGVVGEGGETSAEPTIPPQAPKPEQLAIFPDLVTDDAAARMKHWLMPAAFPPPPDRIWMGDRPPRPHHRRGGRRSPDPGPRPLQLTLRLFRTVDGQADTTDTAEAIARGLPTGQPVARKAASHSPQQ